MERALQRECGYDGGLPYLDFTNQSVPRCLERRFDPTKALPILTDANIAQHIRDGVDAATFAPNLETLPQPIHSAIHDLISGLQEDVAVSPGDPMFFLIHCFLDLIWAIWQSLDYNSRTYDLAPSEAWAPERQQLKRLPPPQVSLGTPLPMTAAFPNSVRVQDVMSTFAGANCYMFV
ncbi:Di-copper centre-containing [Lecanosticta acicola]|uniref:Di-copper centre-containing n=1 Tax=Lecanosticta acicola TaxID=111012 RepID=A0AAI8YVT3_9PEZI|nr:Di-copper centre-containing [Lecanosticta acicola]